MNNAPRTHSYFERPPVIETVFDIQFHPLQGWEIPFFGLFWATIRDRYPKFKVVPPLGTQIEDASKPLPPLGVLVNLSAGLLPTRCWFFNEPETQLIQVQSDRFILNWKRGLIDARYPHYENIQPLLEREWQHFCEFVGTNTLGKIEIRQCEITYINHIDVGIGWKDYGELDAVLTIWSGNKPGGILPTPDNASVAIRYRLPDSMGRLHVLAEPAVRNEDNQETLQLTMIARGTPASSEPKNVFDWFDHAQGFVREAFVDLTTERMHAIWEIKDQS